MATVWGNCTRGRNNKKLREKNNIWDVKSKRKNITQGMTDQAKVYLARIEILQYTKVNDSERITSV